MKVKKITFLLFLMNCPVHLSPGQDLQLILCLKELDVDDGGVDVHDSKTNENPEHSFQQDGLGWVIRKTDILVELILLSKVF